MRDVEGGCHCGRIRFRATVDLEQAVLCNCSMCTKKGFIHLIIPPERFQLLSGGDGDISVYRCLDDIDPAELRLAPFDGKNWETAQAASLAAKAERE